MKENENEKEGELDQKNNIQIGYSHKALNK